MRAQSRNHSCRIHDNFKIGKLAAVVLENEKLRITVAAGRGADVVEFLHKPNDLDLVWLTPNGLVDGEVNYNYNDPLGAFTDEYPGGWQTIFPNGGAASNHQGADFGQHAEMALLPWDFKILKDTPEEISVEFFVYGRKTPFLVKRTMSLKSNSTTLDMVETIENLSDVEIPTMWGFHFTFGPPFMDDDCRVVLPGKPTVMPHASEVFGSSRRLKGNENFAWPVGVGPDDKPVDFSKIPPRDTPTEMLYLKDLEQGEYRVESPNKGLAAVVKWDKTNHPYLWFWQEFGATTGYPWYGRYYNIGLEPFSSLPTTGVVDSVNNGTALIFKGREVKSNKFSFGVEKLK